jgi:D-alanine transfer protein
MLKKLIYLHFVPLSIAISLVYICLLFSQNIISNIEGSQGKTITIEGKQDRVRSYYANLTKGDQPEIDFISSIKNKEQLTIFGSSEFSDSPYCSYNFLSDSLGVQSMGLGHAHHQNFSVLCELLAADEYVNSSNICIMLSLDWFNTEGTNTSAFLEFVRPNFLKRIIRNKNIDIEYKKYIGSYINDHSSEMDGLTKEMKLLRDVYISNTDSHEWFLRKKYQLSQFIKKSPDCNNVEYNIELRHLETRVWKGNMDVIAEAARKDFVSKITNNDLFVYDAYYSKYLIDSLGDEKKGSVTTVDMSGNKELNDFAILIKYLSSKGTNVSMVLQPLNPYYYKEIEKFDKLVDTLTTMLDNNKIPYLNMYVSSKKNYEPGVLKDIMHVGNYGWMQINSFLMNLYYES